MKRRIAFLLMTMASLFFWDRSLYAVLSTDAQEPGLARPAQVHPEQAQMDQTAANVPAATVPATALEPAAGPALAPRSAPARNAAPAALPLRIDLVPPAGWEDLPCVRQDLDVRGG